MATYRASFAGGGTSSTSDRTITFTPAVDDLLVVFASLSANTQSSVGCTDDQGGTYTQVLQALWSTSLNNMVCWVRTAKVPSAVQHIITIDTDTNTAGEIVVVAIAGMAKVGSAAVRSSGSQANQASGGTPTPVLNQNALTGNMTLWAVASSDTTTSPNASWTERQDVSQSTPTTALEVATRDSGFTGTSIAAAATQSTVYASMALELDGGIDGTLSKTLAAPTLAATGALDIVGSASVTVAGPTLSATGALDIVGTLSAMLSALTLVAAGALDIAGAVDATLPGPTLVATGILETLPINGELSVTLSAPTLVATGTLDIMGAAAVTLAAPTCDATGTLDILGTVAATLPEPSLSAIGALDIFGTLAGTLHAPMLTAEGALHISASADAALPAPMLSAASKLDITGNIDVALPGPTLIATGIIIEGGQGDLDVTLPGPTLVATGELAIIGVADILIPGPTCDATGFAGGPIVGELDVTILGPTCVATGTMARVTYDVSLVLVEPEPPADIGVTLSLVEPEPVVQAIMLILREP